MSRRNVNGNAGAAATSGQGVSESKADLVSIEVSETNQPTFSASAWARRTKLEKLLIALLLIAMVVLAAIVGVSLVAQKQLERERERLVARGSGEMCESQACVHAAHGILQNMDETVDPCEDFYQYACGGFEKRVRYNLSFFFKYVIYCFDCMISTGINLEFACRNQRDFRSIIIKNSVASLNSISRSISNFRLKIGISFANLQNECFIGSKNCNGTLQK